jgi:hypothetical protein
MTPARRSPQGGVAHAMLSRGLSLSGSGLMVLGNQWGAEQNNPALRAYIADRAHLLNKLCTDHILWLQSLDAFGRNASLAATWVDVYGREQTVAINWPYLDAHRKNIRSLMHDLLACGPAGQRAVEGIVALQTSMMEEGEAR